MLILIFPILVWRRMHLKEIQLKFELELFALRDKLRIGVMKGKISNHDPLFDYFDKTISRTIKNSYYITMFRIIALMVVHFHNKRTKEISIKLSEDIHDNEFVKNEIAPELYRIIAEYLIDQHKVSYYLLSPFAFVAGAFAKLKRRVVESVFVLPETAEPYRFAQ